MFLFFGPFCLSGVLFHYWMGGPMSFRINQLEFALEPCFLQLLRPFFTGKVSLNGARSGFEDEEIWGPSDCLGGGFA